MQQYCRISLEEELDALRVQSAMDRATVQDLNICLKQERQQMKLRHNNRDDGNYSSLLDCSNLLFNFNRKARTKTNVFLSPISFCFRAFFLL